MASRRRRATLFVTAAVLIFAVIRLTVPVSAQASAGGSFSVAPYVDMTNAQEGMLDNAISHVGLKAFTAAFVIGSGCTPIWGDTLPVADDPTVSGEIAKATSAGAPMIVSFGGASGTELAQSCSNLNQLVAAYQSVIKQFGLTHIDFDVEGAAIADTASVNLRFQAIAELEAADPGLVVSVTIPVDPTGPDSNGRAFLQAAKADGARLDVINVMTMDYYGSWDSSGATMGAYATEAAQNTLGFARTLWPADTYADIGVTPMIGRNDDSAETFTEADANTLVSFAESNGLGRLAFWSVDRDQPCSGTATSLPACSEISQQSLDFTGIFDKYAGATPPSPPTSDTSAPVSTPSASPDSSGTPPTSASPSTPTPTSTPTHSPTATHSPTTTHSPRATHSPTPTHNPTPTHSPTTTRSLTTTTTSGPSHVLAQTAGDPITNPGFESGNLTGWTCDAGTGSVVTSPVHSGTYALAATPTASDEAMCSQVVPVRPGTAYTLSAWVRGQYVFLGADGTGASDALNWTSTSSWQHLSTSFTTGTATTTVTIYIHGWYQQGTINADDFTLT